MTVTDFPNTSMEASTTIAVPSMPLPPGPQDLPEDLRDEEQSPAESAESTTGRLGEGSDAALVSAARAGSTEAFEALFGRWFERSWNVARTIVGHDDTAAEVAQDSVLKAWQRLDDLDKPESFGAWLLSITRNRALDRVRRDNRSPVVDDVIVADLRDQQLQAGRHDWMAAGGRSVSGSADSHRNQEMVWAAAAALGAEDSALLDLHLRHGLTAAELADSTGGTVNAAHQQLFRLRRRLGDAIGAYVLWRSGAPLCCDLDAVLPINDDGIRFFDRSVAKLVVKHVGDCHRCGADRAAILDPAALFASVPLVVVPASLQRAAAEGLTARGVPVEAAPIEKLNLSDMADIDGSLLLTQVVDGPKPPPIRRLDEPGRALLEDDFTQAVDLDAVRPEWNPDPILSEAESLAPPTSPNVVDDAAETRSWQIWFMSPAAMAGIGVGLALTVMAVALAARSEPASTETANGNFGVGVSAGEESALARTVTSGGRAEADPRADVPAIEDSLDASAAIADDAVTSSYGAAVPVGDDDDKLVARSAAGAARITTDEDTGDTSLRDPQELLASDVANDVTEEADDVSDDVATNTTTVGGVLVDEAGRSVSEENLAGGIAAAPLATTPTSSVLSGEVDSAASVSRSDDASDDDDSDDRGTESSATSVASQPSTTEARPTEPPTTNPVVSQPSTTASPATNPPTTTPRPTEPPTTANPTTANPTTAPPVDDEVDDDDVEDEVDDEPADLDDSDDGPSSGSNNSGGSPSDTRPTRDSNPSDTRPENGRSGDGAN